MRRIADAAREAGRAIDPEHYGASFSYRFGSYDDPIVDATARGFARFSPDLDPKRYLAAGGAREILARLEEYRAAGISKFILRPMASGEEDVMEQTRRLVEEVIPSVHGGG